MLANLVWFDELEIGGWIVATLLAIAAGAAVWLFAGTTWLVIATSLYLALLVAAKILGNRGRRPRRASSQSRAGR